jgi:hypothetical protein
MTTIQSISELRLDFPPYYFLEIEDEEIGKEYNKRYFFAGLLDVLKDGKPTLCAVFDKCDKRIRIQLFQKEKDGLFACFAENHQPLCFQSPWSYNTLVRQFYKEVNVKVFA